MESRASIPLDPSKIDKSIVSKYLAEERLMESLSEWTLLADSRHLSDLQKVAELVRKLQSPKIPSIVFRGFRPNGLQDNLGTVKKKFLFNEIVHHDERSVFRYKPVRPLSFTSEVEIARAFGDIIVEADIRKIGDHCLLITDELAYAIGVNKLGPPHTQREIVVFPSVGELSFKIIRSSKIALPPSSRW